MVICLTQRALRGAKTGLKDGRYVVEVWHAYHPYATHFVKEFEGEPGGLTFSADSRYLIAQLDGRMRVFDISTKEEIGILGQHGCLTCVIVASRDGKYIASTGGNGSVKIWDAQRLNEQQAGRLVSQWEAHFFFKANFCPVSNRLAFGGPDGEIRIVDVESGEWDIPNAHGDRVSCVSFSPDGKYLASCSFD